MGGQTEWRSAVFEVPLKGDVKNETQHSVKPFQLKLREQQGHVQ